MDEQKWISREQDDAQQIIKKVTYRQGNLDHDWATEVLDRNTTQEREVEYINF